MAWTHYLVHSNSACIVADKRTKTHSHPRISLLTVKGTKRCHDPIGTATSEVIDLSGNHVSYNFTSSYQYLMDII